MNAMKKAESGKSSRRSRASVSRGPKKTARISRRQVPTEDRISIQRRVVRECRVAVAKACGVDRLTPKEWKRILELRSLGHSIKSIAKIVHRRDRTVSAFLAARMR